MNLRRFALLALVTLTLLPFAAQADSILWNSGVLPNMYAGFLPVRGGTESTGDWRVMIFRPTVNVSYAATVVNADTGEVIGCGATIPLGTHITYKFATPTYLDINWFGTGYNFDSPYGDWVTTTDPPPVQCLGKDKYDSFSEYAPGPSNSSCSDCTGYLYAPLEIQKQTKAVDGVGFTCGAADGEGGISCVADKLGTMDGSFNFPDTDGVYYMRMISTGSNLEPGMNQCSAIPRGRNIPLEAKGSGGFSTYHLHVPAQTISCAITVITVDGLPPTGLTLSGGGAAQGAGSCTVGAPYTVIMKATDPDNDTIRYAVDWDGNGTVDQFLPSTGYVPSGTQESASRTYSVGGTKNIKVLAEDSRGLTSGWVSLSATCNGSPDQSQGQNGRGNSGSNGDLQNTIPSLTLKALPSLVRSNQTTTVSWSASSVLGNTCKVTSPQDSVANGTGLWAGAVSTGVASSHITEQTTYTLSCLGLDNTPLTQSATVNIIPGFQEL